MQKMIPVFAMWLVALNAYADATSMLVYRVWEQGLDPYISRILVTPDHVRLDEGSDDGPFTLFDRQQEIIYNVSPEDGTVLVISSYQPVPAMNDGLILAEEVTPDTAAPKVAGQQPNNVRLLANGEVCAELATVDGVMEDAVEALAELKLVLARVQAQTLSAMPLSMRTPCDLASNVYAADRTLRFGLPLQERSAGRRQSLVDFAPAVEVDAAIFKLPSDYRRQSIFTTDAI